MRAETLLFFHLLAAAALLGTLLIVAVLATAGGTTRRLTFRSSVAATVSALATVALGEATRAQDGAAGTWLDVGSALGYAGLLMPSFLLALAAALATGERRQMLLAGLAWTMLAVALGAAFIMSAKPF